MLLYRNTIQSAATTGNGTAFDLNGELAKVTFYIKGAGTVSAGEIQIEEAMTTTDAGFWAPLGSPVTVVSGSTETIHFEGAFLALRARISTTVTGSGGSVTVEAVAATGEV